MSIQEQDKVEHAKSNAAGWLSSIEEMLEPLDIVDEEDPSHDEAMQTIHESVLSVLVRDGWREPGGEIGPNGDAEEYEILLSTGGPALRIWGKLDQYSEPESAELQMQDWFLPWTRFPAAEATLLQFARCFYFGD
jgi:hypothetical protein